MTRHNLRARPERTLTTAAGRCGRGRRERSPHGCSRTGRTVPDTFFNSATSDHLEFRQRAIRSCYLTLYLILALLAATVISVY